jgi:hypothetical protein
MKSNLTKTSIGKAWAKIFHTKATPGVKANNPYFMVAVKETQRWGNKIFLLLCFCYSFELDSLFFR